MKHLKVGSLAIVALLAMSFTIASHEGAFKKSSSKSKAAFTCQIDTRPVSTAIFFRGIKRCSDNVNFDQGIDGPAAPSEGFQLCAEPLVVNSEEQVVCNGGTKFCCAEVITTNPLNCTAPCKTVKVYSYTP